MKKYSNIDLSADSEAPRLDCADTLVTLELYCPHMYESVISVTCHLSITNVRTWLCFQESRKYLDSQAPNADTFAIDIVAPWKSLLDLIGQTVTLPASYEVTDQLSVRLGTSWLAAAVLSSAPDWTVNTGRRDWLIPVGMTRENVSMYIDRSGSIR